MPHNYRQPTFWLECCCCLEPEEEAQYLPLYLMVSKRLVILYGLEYTSSLHCVWEVLL